MRPNRVYSLVKQVYSFVKQCFCRTYNWQGVYASFGAAEPEGAGFEGDAWADGTVDLARNALIECQENFIPDTAKGDNILLGFLVGLLANEKRAIRILDFGGGAGVSYIYTSAVIGGNIPLDYHVVESSAVAAKACNIFPGKKDISFATSVPKHLGALDIVYAQTSLQYVEDSDAVLEQLACLAPRFFLFSKLSAGECPDFVTTQVNVPGCRIAYKFLNLPNFISKMQSLGYILRFKSSAQNRLDMANFPATHRIPFSCNLLFERELVGQ